MIEFNEEIMNKDKLIELTKDIKGIRYKTNNDGSFVAYATGWTMIVDMFKRKKNK